MKNLSIVFTAIGKAEILREPCAMPAAGQVLTETTVSTISSGTERANLCGEINSWKATDADRDTPHFPRRCGYSAAGRVIAVGEGVSDVHEGDRVALLWSAHRKYNLLSASNVCRIDSDRITDEDAALFTIGTFPLAAIRKCRLEIGESALVMGLGVLGRMALLQLRAAGAAPIIACDPIAAKREQALQNGADFAFDPLEEGFAEKVRAVSGGGVRVAIEVTGNGGGLNGALDCMAPLGRVALLGCTRDPHFTVDYYRKVHGPGISLIGAHTHARPRFESSPGLWTQRDDVLTQMQLIACGRTPPRVLVEETHTPDEAPQVYARLMREKAFPLVQFDWRGFGE